MKKIILGALLAALAINASAGYQYIYKGADGQTVMTNKNPDDNDAIKPFKSDYQVELEEKRLKEIEYRKQLAKKPSAAIGMTKSQVKNKTSWGEPRYIKTTTSKYGTHEQWVYDDYQYLYFDDGKLTTIQQ